MVRGAPTGRGPSRGRAASASAGRSTRARPASATGDRSETATPQPSTSNPLPPSAAPAPTPTPATSTISTRGSTSRGVGPSLGARFRPRNVRRNEEEREMLAQQEAKKDSERLAEERRRRGRGRFRGRRGRGNQFGPRMSRVEASGLFAGQHGVAGPSRGGFGFGGGRGAPGLLRGGAGPRGRHHKFETEDRPWEMRINTDKLGVTASTTQEDDDLEEEATLMAVSSQPGPRPLGITRREEKEREVVVVTNAELEEQNRGGGSQEDSLWVGGSSGDESPVEARPADDKVWHAAPSSAVQVKTEDGELQTVGLEAPTIDFDLQRNVPLPKKTEEEEAEREAVGKPEAKTAKPAASLDPEEEWNRESLQYILSTLAAASLKDRADGDGDGEEAHTDMSEPQPFLCKFGPVMPPLRPTPRAGSQVKDEPSDAVMLDQLPLDLTADGADEDADADEDGDPFKHGGFVGKLVIRKSGMAELDYGGVRYNMRRGIKSSGVTSYVLVEQDDVKEAKQEQFAGRAVAMGTLMGKFNFGPVYEEQEEWVVSEEDLRVPDEQE